jgi:hypothetical protein
MQLSQFNLRSNYPNSISQVGEESGFIDRDNLAAAFSDMRAGKGKAWSELGETAVGGVGGFIGGKVGL